MFRITRPTSITSNVFLSAIIATLIDDAYYAYACAPTCFCSCIQLASVQVINCICTNCMMQSTKGVCAPQNYHQLFQLIGPKTKYYHHVQCILFQKKCFSVDDLPFHVQQGVREGRSVEDGKHNWGEPKRAPHICTYDKIACTYVGCMYVCMYVCSDTSSTCSSHMRIIQVIL